MECEGKVNMGDIPLSLLRGMLPSSNLALQRLLLWHLADGSALCVGNIVEEGRARDLPAVCVCVCVCARVCTRACTRCLGASPVGVCCVVWYNSLMLPCCGPLCAGHLAE